MLGGGACAKVCSFLAFPGKAAERPEVFLARLTQTLHQAHTQVPMIKQRSSVSFPKHVLCFF